MDENGNPYGSWEKMEDLPAVPRELGTGFAIDDFGYFGLGGQFNRPAASDFWRYNPLTNTWEELAAIGTVDETFRRQGAVSFVIGQTAYIGTGDILIANQENIADNQFFRYFPEPEE